MANDEKELNTLEDLICKAYLCNTRYECESKPVCRESQVMATAVTEWFKKDGWVKAHPVDMGKLVKLINDIIDSSATRENIIEGATSELSALIQSAIAQAFKERVAPSGMLEATIQLRIAQAKKEWTDKMTDEEIARLYTSMLQHKALESTPTLEEFNKNKSEQPYWIRSHRHG
jgi:hypothetical protein